MEGIKNVTKKQSKKVLSGTKFNVAARKIIQKRNTKASKQTVQDDQHEDKVRTALGIFNSTYLSVDEFQLALRMIGYSEG